MKLIVSYAFVAIILLAGCEIRAPESTADQYCAALLVGDHAAFRNLFESKRRSYINENSFALLRFEYCEIMAVSSPYVDIGYGIRMGDTLLEDTGSLYILPDGSIKYDPIFVMHPALALEGLLSQMKDDDARMRRSAELTLAKWGIPIFGFTHDASSEERAKSIAQFQYWVDLNRATFDLGEVTIPLSPFDRERIIE